MLVTTAKQTHTNPVYGSYFADPFVWRHEDTYYAIGTGELEANGQVIEKVFPLLLSTDFFEWKFASSALVRPDKTLGGNFWAPAIAHADDKFYLYYSVGHGDKNHQLRVAASNAPQGPIVILGKPCLTPINVLSPSTRILFKMTMANGICFTPAISLIAPRKAALAQL
jgi:arabinan endo-1,5-alpha-L-arabinosidase